MEKFGEERISQILGKSSSIYYIYDTLIDHLTLTILDSKKSLHHISTISQIQVSHWSEPPRNELCHWLHAAWTKSRSERPCWEDQARRTLCKATPPIFLWTGTNSKLQMFLFAYSSTVNLSKSVYMTVTEGYEDGFASPLSLSAFHCKIQSISQSNIVLHP